jgi:hypothetical protein
MSHSSKIEKAHYYVVQSGITGECIGRMEVRKLETLTCEPRPVPFRLPREKAADPLPNSWDILGNPWLPPAKEHYQELLKHHTSISLHS